ncbi:Aste57867_880 [Aphanomyces stellatus]|uniref:Aste57867_880 protein n=1 Tax=Aphanomyces stellatus TaxID=120398 RepID=A0A485K6F3_9STRA|nr:hypothetical protein As57867_000879 [Aphanomyces stellatus]VFT78104.1 Aste57867_880 [Aphanomyces stellatus]
MVDCPSFLLVLALATVAIARPLFEINTTLTPTFGPMTFDDAAVVTTNDDWAFLQLPPTQQLLAMLGGNQSLAEILADKRLDVWTHLMGKLVQVQRDHWKRPHAHTNITIPTQQTPLAKITLAQSDIQVPTTDEDWPAAAATETAAINYLRDVAPFIDNFHDTWTDGEGKEAYVMTKVGHMWPTVEVFWTDRYSDQALSLLVFNGLGQHVVEKLPEAQDDGSYYVVLLNYLNVLDVRPGFAKYGADAFFDQDGNVIKIVREAATYYPGDDKWEYVKMAFRGSLMAKVTAIDHLLGGHMTVANYMTTATREQLPPDHPLRRLLKPFTFRSVAVNRIGAELLFWAKGLMDRAFAFTQSGWKQLWQLGTHHIRFEPFPDAVARQNIDTTTLPFHEDGLAFWTIARTYASDYLDVYFGSDDDVINDASIVAFWGALTTAMPMKPLALESLKDVVAQTIVWVTAFHNHFGHVAEYVSDPAFTPVAWVEGELSARPGVAVRTAIIMVATGLSQPSILEDFSHVLLDDAAIVVAKAFTTSLVDLGTAVNDRNNDRIQAFESFNPQDMDISIGV